MVRLLGRRPDPGAVHPPPDDVPQPVPRYSDRPPAPAPLRPEHMTAMERSSLVLRRALSGEDGKS